MTDILAVFRSRSQALDCMNKMRAYKITAQLINTPREANVGCGLSLKIPQNAAARARAVISRMGYSSFYGYMRIDYRGGKMVFRGF